MQIETGEKRRGRFRRVSRARIFDGPILKVSVYAATVMIAAYLLVTATITLLFSFLYKVDASMVLWGLLPGAVLGFLLLIMERLLSRLKEMMFPGMGRLLTAFLLFFLHTIGYLSLSSIVVSYPIGFIMERSWSIAGLAGDYSLFSVNFFIILAIFSWLRNVRTPPCKCL